MLGIRLDPCNRDAQLCQSGRADGHEQRRSGRDTCVKIAKSREDQLRARQSLESGHDGIMHNIPVAHTSPLLMRAVVYRQYGPPELVLRCEDVDAPSPLTTRS